MDNLFPLTGLRCGESAEIGHVSGGPDAVQRLQEMGLRPGCVVEMVQPGSPCIIRLAGGKLCFREGEMARVWVRLGVLT